MSVVARTGHTKSHGDDTAVALSPSYLDGKDNQKEQKGEGDLPKLPFITTSDVLNRLNKNLTELAKNNADESLNGLSPRFELQKRLPNGATIPASASDLAYSDVQTKIQQSAQFVAALESDAERVRWAEAQRQVGNSYFQKAQYPAAMDIYLTCLVVKQDTPEFLRQTLLPVLNNLAQCTLQLGMHKKTMEFCDIALNELEKYPIEEYSVSPSSPPSSSTTTEGSIRITTCKIYFKRAKARRLTGSYRLAREDLNRASAFLLNTNGKDGDGRDDDEDDDSQIKLHPYLEAIQKESRLLEAAEREARKNRERQKRAMQKALLPQPSPNPTSGVEPITELGCSSAFHEKMHHDNHVAAVPAAPRKYSTLRAPMAPRKSTITTRATISENQRDNLSYLQYYCLVVARVAETLLIWMGDEETIRKVKERIE